MADRLKIIDRKESSTEDEDDLEKLVVDARERDKWDCESILSTYSNIYNHPKLIAEPKVNFFFCILLYLIYERYISSFNVVFQGPGKIRIDPRTGIPKDVLDAPGGKLTMKALAKFDSQNENRAGGGPQSVAETMKSTLSILSIRPKDETAEERKERKKALKDYRKVLILVIESNCFFSFFSFAIIYEIHVFFFSFENRKEDWNAKRTSKRLRKRKNDKKKSFLTTKTTSRATEYCEKCSAVPTNISENLTDILFTRISRNDSNLM